MDASRKSPIVKKGGRYGFEGGSEKIADLAKLTEDDKGKLPSGFVYKDNVGHKSVVARWVDATGEVWLTKSFFEHGEEERRDILAHEIGHGLVSHLTTDDKASTEQFWPMVDAGVLGKWSDEKNRFIGLGGQRNPDEVLADLAKDYLMRPEELKKRYPKQYGIVKKIIEGGKVTKDDL